jgi:hypothetical protein
LGRARTGSVRYARLTVSRSPVAGTTVAGNEPTPGNVDGSFTSAVCATPTSSNPSRNATWNDACCSRAHRRTVSGPDEPWMGEDGWSRSLSTTENVGPTSAQDQPARPQPS